MRLRLAAFVVLLVVTGALGLAQNRPAGQSITGSWEAYPLRGEGFGSGVPPKVPVAPPKPIPEPPLRQPYLDRWRALQAQNAELTRKGLPPPSTGMACMPQGMPAMMQSTFPMEILETPGQVTIIQEAFTQVRRIFLDADFIPHQVADHVLQRGRRGPRAGTIPQAIQAPYLCSPFVLRDAFLLEPVEIDDPRLGAGGGLQHRMAGVPEQRCEVLAVGEGVVNDQDAFHRLSAWRAG